ncbi:MAG TPA: hypothetical protein VLM40_10235 [Gemmata sp.]|nr:hypothetical protein [Gemmata sp.]
MTKCAAAVAVVVGLGFASAGSAAAHPPRVILQPSITPYPYVYPSPYPATFPRVDRDYLVYYRPSVIAPWQVYGRFETHFGAERAVDSLQRFGLPTRIQRVRDFGIGW